MYNVMCKLSVFESYIESWRQADSFLGLWREHGPDWFSYCYCKALFMI